MAGFGKTPTTTTQGAPTTNQFPASSVYPPNKGGNNPTDDFFALEGGPISTDDDSNKSSPASMYIKDGGDVTKGTQTDAAWSGSGAATEIAILKKVVALLTAALTVSGTVTANAGTNMSTAALALETGGNLAGAKTDLDSIVTSNSAINTATGAQADAVWTGSGSGSEIAILKKIVAELAATLTVSGSVSVSNLPGTQPVSGTFWQATQPVSSASLPLPTGAAQEAGHLATIDAHTPALGQVAMVSSSPVVIASDQSKLPTKAASGDFVAGSIADIATLLTLSGTPTDANTVNSLIGRLTKIRDLLTATLTISGAVTTSGTVTEANSAGIKTDLDTVVTNTNKIPTSPAQEGGNLALLVTNTTSIATAANQTTTNTSLTTIGTNTANIPAKGTAIMTGSEPVTIATDDTQMTAIKNSVANIPAKGTAVISASTPVNIASDQIVPIKRSSVAAFTAVQTAVGTGNSGDITVGTYTEISLDISTSAQAGTSPTIQFFWNRKGADGIYYPLWQSAVLTVAANKISTSIGAGMAYNQSLGLTGQLSWVVGGSATPTWTFTPNIYGK